MTTSTGAVAERYAYTAYGQPTILNASGSLIGNQQSQIANRFTYTGREWDETLGLHHFRARWMSPLAGRFLGRDPIGYVDGFCLYYKYFSLSSMDPTGLEDEDPWQIEGPPTYGYTIWGYYYRHWRQVKRWKKDKRVVEFPLDDGRCCPGKPSEDSFQLELGVQAALGIFGNAFGEWLELTPNVGISASISHTHTIVCDGVVDQVRRPRATIIFEYREVKDNYDYRMPEYAWVWDPLPRYVIVGYYWENWYSKEKYELRNVNIVWDDFVVPTDELAPPCDCDEDK